MSWRDREEAEKEMERDKSRGDVPMQTSGQIRGGGTLRAYSEEEMLNEVFSYHPPNVMQTAKYETIREAARHFAKVLLMNTPPGADRTCALRHIREAVMTANAAVALNGLSF